MSVRDQAIRYTGAAVVLATVIMAASTLYLSQPIGNSGQLGGVTSNLVIRLTDPPVVPRGTSSLNLTYSSIGLLVGKPSGGGQTMSSITSTPAGGSATLDLLRLQNVSQTIATQNLTSGTAVYSFSFAVTGISVDVNGTDSPVSLATGGSTLTVTLGRPYTIQADSVALLQLNPVVVNTPGGYQLIPSAVGFVRAQSQGDQGNEQVGQRQSLSSEDENQLETAQGNLSASLTSISVSGNSTTITVEVRNNGNASVMLNAIGIRGNFTSQGQSCMYGMEMDSGCQMGTYDGVVFTPVNATVSGASCVSEQMQPATGDSLEGAGHGLTVGKGQCVDLTFSGVIRFGDSGSALVPSTAAGQVYDLRVIASEGANLGLSCKLPITSSSCTAMRQEGD